MSSRELSISADRVLGKLKTATPTTSPLVLFVLSGLPGTGKSYLARKLSERVPCVIVETDFVRKIVARPPTYTPAESAFVHRVAQQVIARLLARGQSAIYDATNLAEWQRDLAYRLAVRANARLVIVRTTSPEAVVRARLVRRRTNRDPLDSSDADWNVYQMLKAEVEPVRRPHLLVDTSGDVESAIESILHAAA